jgi:hypothetical protein
MPNTQFWQEIHAIADARTPAFRRLFAELIAQAQRGMTSDAIRAALARGDAATAFRVAEDAFNAASAEWQSSIVAHLRGALDAAGIATQPTIPSKGSVSFAFDLVNPQAVNWIRDNAARLVRDITADTRTVIRDTIQRAFQDGITADQTARALRENIGLTSRMARSVDTFRANLMESGSTQSAAEAAATKYRARLIAQRAETIARTEIMRASNQGQQEAWRQAVDRGFLPDNPVQQWIVTPDDRLCEVCRPMKGQRRSIGENFVSPTDGSTAKTPPIHPRCRCAIGIDIKATRERARRVA